MAKNVAGNPWKFDAADQAEGKANSGEAGVVHPEIDPYIDTIIIESGATGGNYEVRETDDGRTLTGVITLGANAKEQISIGHRTGVYVEAFGSDGQILVYHGEPVA